MNSGDCTKWKSEGEKERAKWKNWNLIEILCVWDNDKTNIVFHISCAMLAHTALWFQIRFDFELCFPRSIYRLCDLAVDCFDRLSHTVSFFVFNSLLRSVRLSPSICLRLYLSSYLSFRTCNRAVSLAAIARFFSNQKTEEATNKNGSTWIMPK